VLITGENGAGKTNLLESLHVGTQGFSPRSRLDAQLVRNGAERSRVAIEGRRGGVSTTVEVTLGVHEAKRARLNGVTLRSAEMLRSELATLVFTPDRLSVVKGGPAVRRAYVDRALGRLLPAKATSPIAYASTLGQRNAVLRRVAAGLSPHDAIGPWTSQLAELGAELVAVRREAIDLLQPGFAAAADELGVSDARLAYDVETPSLASLESRLPKDLERGATGLGPHLDEIGILAGARDLRAFGSQGEQRVAVLALLLAEADLLASRGSAPPLLLLDDVLSELDTGRRRCLALRVGRLPQAVVTATAAEPLPLEPAQLFEVTPGRARLVV
jgi:DNA replication and repair protein RecF